MSTLTAVNSYYHLSAINGQDASPWLSGPARKGALNGESAIGLVLFDADAIAADLSGNTLTGAKLVLTRDSTYGTGSADMAIAPVSVKNVSGDMSHEQCLDMSLRNLHHVAATEGDTATVQLPGAHLRGLARGEINGFLIYQEAGEGTDAYLQFGGDAYLMLDVTTAWTAPVWTRPVAREDIISDHIRSHIGDLNEIEYYLNIRRAMQSLEAISLGLGSSCLYSLWYGLINTLRTATEAVLAAEQKTAPTWCALDPDELPSAEAVNELRQTLELPVTGDAERFTISTYARYSFENVGKDFTVNRSTAVSWAKKAPMSGMNWGYETRNGSKVKVYNRRFGFWLFGSRMQGKYITSAKFRVTRSSGRGGSWPVTLYPIKVASVPTGKTSVNAIFETASCGSANCAVGGTVDIPLSAAFIQRCVNGEVYGVGVDDHEDWTNFSGSGTLILNE